MQLSLLERLLVPTILPQQGGIVELRVAQEVLECVQLTSDELEEWEVKDGPEGRVTWNPDKATEVEIALSDPGKAMIRKALKELEEGKQLERNHVSLYEKFAEQAPAEEPQKTE